MASLSVWRLTRPGAPTIQVTSSYRGLVSEVVLVDTEEPVTGSPWRTKDDMLAWARTNGYAVDQIERASATAWRDPGTSGKGF